MEAERKKKEKLRRYIDAAWAMDWAFIFLSLKMSVASTIFCTFFALVLYETFLGDMHERISIKSSSFFLGMLIVVGVAGYCYLQGVFDTISSWFSSTRYKPRNIYENVG